MKFLKHLILPISVICCCNNIGNTMEKQTQINNYSNGEKVWNNIENIMSSFQNEKLLSNDQNEFIKKLCNDSIQNFDGDNYLKIVNYNSLTCFFYENNKNISECCTYFNTIMFPSINVINTICNKIIKTNVNEQDIENIYCNLLKRIKQCYTWNIITKENYILLLQNLLYYNTNDVFYKIGNNTSTIKDQYFNINNPLYCSFINISERKEDIDDDIGNEFYYSNTSELLNSYKLYKSVMNKIIDDLITVLVFDNCCLEAIQNKIFDPIILGLFCAKFNTNPKCNNCDNIDRCSVNPYCGIYMYQIMNSKKYINSNNQYCTDNEKEQLYIKIRQNTSNIDTEFNITEKINKIK